MNSQHRYGVWLIAAVLFPVLALAHKPSDSYLHLNLNTPNPKGRWDVALRDLDFAIGLDTDGDGEITWGELKSRHAAIADYALTRLHVSAEGAPCQLQPRRQLVDRHSDGTYTVLRFNIRCPAGAVAQRLNYSLFFDLDPSHRGLLHIEYPASVQTAVLSPEHPRIDLRPFARSGWQQFAEYWREGVWHIWIGFDHILFLVALLLPVLLDHRSARRRQDRPFRHTVLDIIGIVTAFTVAHSITLSAAVLGWVSIPSRWVETAIAGTIIVAALNNVFPLVTGRRWLIGFCLGLIHGLGFASVLSDLGLPGGALALALAGFNLGVETGQLAIVVGFLGVAFVLRGSRYQRRGLLELSSIAVAVVATAWLLDRGLGLG